MSAKTKLAASAQTSGLAEVDIIINAKVSEHLGTTHSNINVVQTHSEDRNQVSSRFSKAHDLNSAPNTRDQDPQSHLVSREAGLEPPPPERDKLITKSADLITYLLQPIRDQLSPLHSTAHDLNSAQNDRDNDDYDADYAKALAEADYQRYLDISLGVIKMSTIRVTLQENAYQFDKEGSIVLASELSPSNIGELFYLLLNADAEFVSEGKVKVDSKAVEESIDFYGTKLKTPRAEAEITLDYFQRLSLLVFYEPDRLTEKGSTMFATWIMWGEKFFVHGCIAYLLYLQQATAVPSSDKQDIQVSAAPVIENNVLMAHEHLPHDTSPTQDALRAPVEPATLFVGRAKSRRSVINPPSLRSTKAPFTHTKAKRASTTTRSEPCAPGPEPVTVLRTSKHRPLGCRRTITNGWLATRASSKGGPVPQEASAIDPVRNLRAVTEIYPSQVTAARVRVTDNPNPRTRPRKRAAQRLRRTQARKLRERLHSRQRPASLYRTGRPLAAPSTAVAVYARLLAHNRSRRQSVVDKDKVSEVVGPYGCIDVPVVDVSTVYGYMYYAYYVTKRDEYSHVPAGIG